MPKAVYRTLKPGDDFAATEGSISDRTPGPMESSDSESDTLDDDSAAQTKGHLKTVWDGGKMKKEHKEGKKVMKCYHCGGQWNSWNHTKAIGHVLGGCKDIKSCPKVSDSWRKLYRTITTTNYETKKSKLEHTAKIHMGADAIEAGISKKMSARRSSPRLKKKAASKKRILEDSEEEEEEEDSSDDILEVYSPPPDGKTVGTKKALAAVFAHQGRASKPSSSTKRTPPSAKRGEWTGRATPLLPKKPNTCINKTLSHHSAKTPLKQSGNCQLQSRTGSLQKVCLFLWLRMFCFSVFCFLL